MLYARDDARAVRAARASNSRGFAGRGPRADRAARHELAAAGQGALRLPRRRQPDRHRGLPHDDTSRQHDRGRRVRPRLSQRVRAVHAAPTRRSGAGSARPAAAGAGRLQPARSRHERQLSRVSSAQSGRRRAFWQFCDEKTRRARRRAERRTRGCGSPSKMVGRWPSGAPLVKSPDAGRPGARRRQRLPVPRARRRARLEVPDRLAHPPRPTRATRSIRSRAPTARSRSASATASSGADAPTAHRSRTRWRSPTSSRPATRAGERGLHFICFNTHIGRQFEFIQHTWVNNPEVRRPLRRRRSAGRRPRRVARQARRARSRFRPTRSARA